MKIIDEFWWHFPAGNFCGVVSNDIIGDVKCVFVRKLYVLDTELH